MRYIEAPGEWTRLMFDYQAAYVSLREDIMATFSSGGTATRSMREQLDDALNAADAAGVPSPVGDEPEEIPVWLSTSDLAYRGGGVMSRRRGSVPSPDSSKSFTMADQHSEDSLLMSMFRRGNLRS